MNIPALDEDLVSWEEAAREEKRPEKKRKQARSYRLDEHADLWQTFPI